MADVGASQQQNGLLLYPKLTIILLKVLTCKWSCNWQCLSLLSNVRSYIMIYIHGTLCPEKNGTKQYVLRDLSVFFCAILSILIGTVENHWKEHGYFRQMPWIPWFCQNAVFSAKMAQFLKLCEFNTKIYLSFFASASKVRVLCYLLAQYVTVTTKFLQMKTLFDKRILTF